MVYGDSGYIGIEKRAEIVENPSLSTIKFRIARKFRSVQVLPENCPAWEKDIELRKASVRSNEWHGAQPKPAVIFRYFFSDCPFRQVVTAGPLLGIAFLRNKALSVVLSIRYDKSTSNPLVFYPLESWRF